MELHWLSSTDCHHYSHYIKKMQFFSYINSYSIEQPVKIVIRATHCLLLKTDFVWLSFVISFENSHIYILTYSLTIALSSYNTSLSTYSKILYYFIWASLCGTDPTVWFKWDQTVTQTTIKSLVKFVLPDYQWSSILHTKQLHHNKCLLMCICDDQSPHWKTGSFPPTTQHHTHLMSSWIKPVTFQRQMIRGISLKETCIFHCLMLSSNNPLSNEEIHFVQ